MRAELLLCALRVLRIVQDELPEVLVAVNIDLRKVHGNGARLRPDDGTAGLDDNGLGSFRKDDLDLAERSLGRDDLRRCDAEAVHADIERIAGPDRAVAGPYCRADTEPHTQELPLFVFRFHLKMPFSKNPRSLSPLSLCPSPSKGRGVGARVLYAKMG